jgi:hypothetical protein
VRALSLWQPWASLYVGKYDRGALVPGPKKWETRHWPTNYRGWLVIHAAQRRASFAELGADLVVLTHARGFDRVEYGAVLGAVLVDHCQHIDHELVRHLGETDPDSLTCGNWARGRWAWRRSHAVPLLEAIPWRGQQGFFEVPDEELPAEFLARIAAAAS